MGDRGRKPAAELSVVGVNELPKYPQPPKDLIPEAREVWERTVRALPQEWFRAETLDTLEQYCKHVVEAQEISRQIQDLKGSDDFDIVTYDRLLKMQERESRASNALARSLRITLQATYDPTKKKPEKSKRPWEV